MDTTFFLLWGAILAFDGLLMAGLTWAAHSEKYRKYRIRTPERDDIPPRRKTINTSLNNVMSLLIFVAYFYFLGEQTLYAGWPGVTRLLGETLGVLLLYDFMYYFYHRGMHVPKVMKYLHGVHHFVRHTTSDKSIYLHPGEAIGGLGLLILAIVILGPISTTAFLLVFFLHSSINIIVHSNLVFPHPAFRLFNFWAIRHDIHHHKVRYNYASIFPFWDQAFGTYQ
ncbi:MAG TPA: sterol desaturase family protein [Nevskiales bacterium]|nr:sterol desaturase family protein [Nevskiales bacterium]